MGQGWVRACSWLTCGPMGTMDACAGSVAVQTRGLVTMPPRQSGRWVQSASGPPRSLQDDTGPGEATRDGSMVMGMGMDAAGSTVRGAGRVAMMVAGMGAE